jgi:hypothetical protein
MKRVWPAVLFLAVAALVILGVLTDYYIHTLSQETLVLVGGTLLGLLVGLAGMAIAFFALVVVVRMALSRQNNNAHYVQPQAIPPVFLIPSDGSQARYYGDGLARRDNEKKIVVVGGDE